MRWTEPRVCAGGGERGQEGGRAEGSGHEGSYIYIYIYIYIWGAGLVVEGGGEGEVAEELGEAVVHVPTVLEHHLPLESCTYIYIFHDLIYIYIEREREREELLEFHIFHHARAGCT